MYVPLLGMILKLGRLEKSTPRTEGTHSEKAGFATPVKREQASLQIFLKELHYTRKKKEEKEKVKFCY